MPGSPVAPDDPAPSTRPPTAGWEPKTLLIGFALVILASFIFWVLPDLVGPQNNRQTQVDINPAAADTPTVVTKQAPIANAKAKIIAEQAVLETSDVTMESTLEDLGIDSLGLVESIFAIEEEFDITVPFNANEPTNSDFDISSVSKIIEGVERLLKEQAG